MDDREAKFIELIDLAEHSGNKDLQLQALEGLKAHRTQPKTLYQDASQMGTQVAEAAPTVMDYAKQGLNTANRLAGVVNKSTAKGLASIPLMAGDIAATPINAISRYFTGEDMLQSNFELFDQGLDAISEATGKSPWDSGRSSQGAVTFEDPQNGPERVLSTGVELGASGLVGIGAGQHLVKSADPVRRMVGETLRYAPRAQYTSAAAGGVASGVAREAGVGPIGQLAAGVVGGGLTGAALIPKPKPQLGDIKGGRTTPLKPQGEIEPIIQAGAEKIGLKWASLDDQVKEIMRDNVVRAMDVDSTLTPEALARKSLYESLGIRPTKALITRDIGDALTEQNLLTVKEGEAVRRIYQQNNNALRANLQGLGDNIGVDQPSFGQAVKGPIAGQHEVAKKTSSTLWDVAKTFEGDYPVNMRPILKTLEDNVTELAVTDAGRPVVAYLKKIGVLEPTPDGSIPVFKQPNTKDLGINKSNLKELEGLRAKINRAWRTASSSGDESAKAQLDQVRHVINEIEEGAGGKLYKAYRTFRVKQGDVFENNPLVDKLLSKEKGYNADKIDDSKVFDSVVLRSTIEDFAPVWDRMPEPVRKLTRGQLAKHIEDSTFSNQGTNEAGDIYASSAKLQNSLASIGEPKLRLIYGPAKFKKIQDLTQAAREISNPPKGTAPQGSAPKMTFLVETLSKLLEVPGFRVAGNIGRAVKGLNDAGKQAAGNVEYLNALDLTPLQPPQSSTPSLFIPSSQAAINRN